MWIGEQIIKQSSFDQNRGECISIKAPNYIGTLGIKVQLKMRGWIRVSKQRMCTSVYVQKKYIYIVYPNQHTRK